MINSYDLVKYFWCAIEFNNLDENILNYTLRFSNIPSLKSTGNFRVTWNTNEILPQISIPGPRDAKAVMGGTPGYYEEGFVFVQHELAMAAADVRFKNMSSTATEVTFDAMRFPFPPYIEDLFIVSLGFIFPLVIVFSFIYPAVNLAKSLVVEKEKRIKESMKMMGLQESPHWISYFIKAIFFLLPSLVVITILLFVKLSGSTSMLNHSDVTLVFVFFLMYEITNILMVFLISSFFSKVSVSDVF